MYKDRYDIEKEQRLQNRVMGGCAVAVIVFLVLIIVCAGCSSHKAATAAETAYTADSVQTAVVATVEKRGMSWGWLQTLCDSINARWTADSVTTPDGAVIHRPVFDLAAIRPQTIAMSATSASEDAITAAHFTATHAAHTQRDTAESSDTAAVYKPPETSALTWLLAAAGWAVLAFVVAWLVREAYTSWRSRHD